MLLIPFAWAALIGAIFFPIYLRESGHLAKVAE